MKLNVFNIIFIIRLIKNCNWITEVLERYFVCIQNYFYLPFLLQKKSLSLREYSGIIYMNSYGVVKKMLTPLFNGILPLWQCKRLHQELHRLKEQRQTSANNTRHPTAENNQERALKVNGRSFLQANEGCKPLVPAFYAAYISCVHFSNSELCCLPTTPSLNTDTAPFCYGIILFHVCVHEKTAYFWILSGRVLITSDIYSFSFCVYVIAF